jgi:small subunit ribosomal protein S6
MRNYELMIIFRKEDDSFARGKELLKSEISRVKANITKEDDMGVRDLAYMVKKENRGHYCLYNLEMQPATVADVDKNLRLSSDVLKYLFVNLE